MVEFDIDSLKLIKEETEETQFNVKTGF